MKGNFKKIKPEDKENINKLTALSMKENELMICKADKGRKFGQMVLCI